MDVTKPQLFDGTSSKISGFITGCKLYLRNKMARATVEEQIQWILTYIWKKNVLEELEAGKVEYESVGEFLVEIKKKFGEGDEKSVKIAELKRIEQGSRMIEDFVQDFKRIVRGSSYEEYPLIEEFK